MTHQRRAVPPHRGLLPEAAGKGRGSDLEVLNAILHVAEHACTERGMPKRFGRWHTRMNRWVKVRALDGVFTALQEEQIIRMRIEALSLDSTIIKVHPDRTGGQKDVLQAIRGSSGGCATKIHMAASDA